MTCIVGVVSGKKVLIGGDSAGIAGYDLSVRTDPKVFSLGEFVIGFTTSFRMGQILAHSFRPPEILPGVDLHAYMTTVFVDEVRRLFKEKGYLHAENQRETGGTFLVGIRGRLFEINNDYQVGENQCGFAAVGCGAQVALGAMYATAQDPYTNDFELKHHFERVHKALRAAEAFNAGVRGPFLIRATASK